ncbi:calponin domain-containing protein [Reticulomyxa filosa]|uniref:Calponin domain-containing protein n=1 Tax=Reticulomyxa filosa TaxID=46433 RepID=X6NM56_RETFI|nr:calponin domain-containing protein [Reticulomyxa filosa]|eukprot:ETO26998.1 calponin domain-containing protein [Reticulomyxa filosa]
MAYAGKAYGFTAEQLEKQKSKYDTVMEGQVVDWLNRCLGTKLKAGGPQQLQKDLQNGVLLCKLALKLKPGSVSEKTCEKMVGNMTFDIQRISAFTAVAKEIGLETHSSFEAQDLRETEKGNMTAVLIGLYNLGVHCYKKKIKNGEGGIEPVANTGTKFK